MRKNITDRVACGEFAFDAKGEGYDRVDVRAANLAHPRIYDGRSSRTKKKSRNQPAQSGIRQPGNNRASAAEIEYDK